jgi:type IV pilus assembly protein PilY1
MSAADIAKRGSTMTFTRARRHSPLLKRVALCLLSTLVVAGSARADDTDLYIYTNSSLPAQPLVMLVIDHRPNLAATICNAGNIQTDSDAVIAANCGWVDIGGAPYTDFVAQLSAADRADGVIDFLEVIKTALKLTLTTVSDVKVGLMISHANNCTGATKSGPGASGCSNGAYVLSGFRDIQEVGTNGATHLDNLVSQLEALPKPTTGTEYHTYQGKEIYFELFRYLTGQGVYNATLGWEDYGDNNPVTNLEDEFGVNDPTLTPYVPTVARDVSVEDGSIPPEYDSPLTEECSKVYALNFLFQVTNLDADSNAAIQQLKGNGGLDGINLTGGSDDQFEQVLRWMRDVDLADGTYGSPPVPDLEEKQNVISYFLAADPFYTNAKATGYAQAGGGADKAYELAKDPRKLVDTLTNLFNQILSVSTTFVASSVPVNVFNRAQYLDSLYLAIFEADEDGKPVWKGNLKKLKLEEDDTTGDATIVDAEGNPAIDGLTGRIAFNALTFWTDPAGADVQSADPTKSEIAGKDGRSVDRGGAGQRTSGFLSGSPGYTNADPGARQLFTEPAAYVNGTATALVPFNADAGTAQALWPYLNRDGYVSTGTTRNAQAWSYDSPGVLNTWGTAPMSDRATAIEVLEHARGLDVDDLDGDSDVDDARPWIVGDTLHSKPLPINYGARGGYTEDNPDIRILVASNDGFIHMYRNTDTAGAESGREDWAFMPHAAMPMLKRLRENLVGSPVHPYGVDGEPVVLVQDTDQDGTVETGENVYLFIGMRRGGKAYQALDISDPDDPKVLWRIDPSRSGFAELGLTFSTPSLGYMNYDGNGPKPVLVFGGGYDTNKDTRNTSPGTDDSEGNAIFIVDAIDGSLVWKAVHSGSMTYSPDGTPNVFEHTELVDSIPSKVAAVDTTSDGLIDRLYVGDTGGNLWRADVVSIDGQDNRENWSLSKLAELGRHANSGKENDRRFFHMPDVVKSSDGNGAFDAVIIGSGDRANPLDLAIGSSEPQNWFYVIKDRATSSVGTLSGVQPVTTEQHDDLADLSDNCFQDISLTCTATQTANLQNGWRIGLEAGEGEKALAKPLTFSNTIFFTSFVPPDTSGTSCTPSEGEGMLYAVNLQDASAVINFSTVDSYTLPDGTIQEITTADRNRKAGVGIAPEVVVIGSNNKGDTLLKTPNGVLKVTNKTRYRTFWYQVEEE